MMFENTLDNYAHFNGLKDVNAYYKILFAISTMIVSLISTSPEIPLLITFLMTFLIIFKAKISWKFYLKFFAIPFSFGFLTFIYMAVFFGVGSPIFEFGIFNLTVTADGFNLGLLVFARMLGGFSCLAFLALTTPMTELFTVLERFRMPLIVLEISMLMYRYIFVFLDEAIIMYHAQETRLGYSNMKKSFNSMGMLVSNLFIKTWVRGEQAYTSMESRGYNGSIRTLKVHRNPKIRYILILISFEALLIIGVYFTSNFKLF